MKSTRQATFPALVVFAILVTIGGYYFIAIPECLDMARICFQSSAPAPYRYRILAIMLERLIAPSAAPALTLWADIAIHSVSVVIVYVGLYKWLRKWIDAPTASIGILLVLGAWLLAFNFYLKTIYTVLEMACIILALLALNRRLIVFAALVIVASLNRETGVFLVLIWMAFHAHEWRTLTYRISAGILLLTYGVVTTALRISLGYADHVLGLAGTWEYNILIRNLMDAIPLNIVLLPIWFMLANGYRYAPGVLQRLAWVGVLYVGAILIGGAWAEMPRLILPLIPLVLPVIVYPIAGHVAPLRAT